MKIQSSLIKEYSFWDLLLHENQGYLGRLTVWAKREGAVDLADITKEEQAELFQILASAKSALNKLFQPDRINYVFLGNKTPHLHCGIIPRYADSRSFQGVKFEDKFFGSGYKTDENFKIPKEVFQKIREVLKNAI